MHTLASDRTFVITLVHGTWAGNAEWTLPESIFRRNLEAELRKLGAGNCAFVDPPFKWSGRNLHEDRHLASIRLRNRLETEIRYGPSTSIPVIIAHSHGGNIALKALRLSPALREHALVITLATPFLRFDRTQPDLLVMPMIMTQVIRASQPRWREVWARAVEALATMRDWSWSRFLLVAAVAVVNLAVVILFFAYVFVPFSQLLPKGFGILCTDLSQSPRCDTIPKWYAATTALILVLGGGLVGLVEARKAVLGRVGARLEEDRERAIARFSYFQPEEPLRSIRLKVLSSGIDEALGALTGAWWMHRTGVWLARLVALLGVLSSFGVALGIAYATTSVLSTGWGELAVDSAIGIAALAILIFVPLVVTPIMYLASSLVARLGQHLGLGVSSFQGGLLTSVSASRRPGNGIPCNYERYRILALLFRSTGALFHSRIYSYPKATQDIARWMVDVSGSGVQESGLASFARGNP